MTDKRYFGLSGRLPAKPGMGEKLAAVLLEASKIVAAAKGCRAYIVSIDQANEDSVSVFEVWDSKEDHDNSLKLAEVKALIGRGMPMIAGKPEGAEFVVLGGTGVD